MKLFLNILLLVSLLATQTVALAQEPEDGPGDDDAAGLFGAGQLPGRDDGQLDNIFSPLQCSDYFNFGGVIGELAVSAPEAVPGEVLNFSTDLRNTNLIPIPEATVLAQVFRVDNDLLDTTGANVLVDQFVVAKNLTLNPDEGTPVNFSWMVPREATNGRYYATFHVYADGQFPVTGFPHSLNITGGDAQFRVKGSPASYVEADRSVVTIKKYRHEFFQTPTVVPGQPVVLETVITNPTDSPRTVLVRWNQYGGMVPSDELERHSFSETVIVPANSELPVSYNVQDQLEALTYVTLTVEDDEHKSIIPFLYGLRDTGQAHFNYVGLDSFPLRSGEPITLFSCAQTAAEDSVSGINIQLALRDSDGAIIHEYGYNGDVTFFPGGYGETFVPALDYDEVVLEAQLFSNEELIHTTAITYSCTDINCSDSDIEVVEPNPFYNILNNHMLLSITAIALLLMLLLVLFVQRRHGKIPLPVLLLFVLAFGVMIPMGNTVDAQINNNISLNGGGPGGGGGGSGGGGGGGGSSNPPSSADTLRAGLQAADGSQSCNSSVGSVGWTPGGSSGGWSPWTGDTDGDDPNCAKIYANPGPTDRDSRLCVEIRDGSTPYDRVCTGWASEGGGWSGWSNHDEFDQMRIQVQNRDMPAGTTLEDVRLGIRTARGDFSCQHAGSARYTPIGGGSSSWATPSNNGDLDCVRVYIEGTVVTNPPSAPTGLTATPRSCGTDEIRLNWNTVSGATSYQVRVGSGSWISVGNTDMYTVDNLTPGNSYSFRVRGVNAGGSGAQSSSVSATAPNNCPVPSASISAGNCTISVNNSSCTVSVSWSSSNASSRSVRQGGSEFSQAASSGGTNRPIGHGDTTFSFVNSGTTLDSDTATASCASGSTWNGSQCAPNATAPGTPGTPAATAGTCGTNRITVSWTAVSGATGYDLRYRQGTSGGWTQVSNVSSPQPVNGLTAGASYQFQVRAKNSVGNSNWSPTRTRTAPGNCPPPVTGSCGSRATSYAFGDSGWPGGSSYCSAGSQTASPSFPTPGNSVIWHCNGFNGGGNSGQCIASRAAAGGCGSAAGGLYTDQPTSNLCSSGSASWSDTNGLDGQFNWSCGATACTANHRPDAPINFTVSAAGACGSGDLYLDWDDVAGADSYSVFFSDGTFVGNSIGSNYSTFSGTPGQSYSFYVRANSPDGFQSTNSSVVSGSPTTCSPTASIEVSIEGGPYTTPSGPITVSDSDEVRIEWSSTDATTCTGSGLGFGTGGNPNGDDVVTNPDPGDSESYSVNCDGTDSNVIVIESGRADLGNINVTHSASTIIDPATGEYDSVTVTFNTENTGISSTVVNPQYVMRFDRGADGYDETSPAAAIGILDAGETSANLSRSFNDVPFGAFQVEVTVDSGDVIAESDESNNVAVYSVNLAPPDPGLSISIEPNIVRVDDDATLTWDTTATYPLDCSVQGPGVSVTDNSVPYSGSTTIGPFSSKSTYTFTCTEPVSGATWSETAAVEVLGTFEEI